MQSFSAAMLSNGFEIAIKFICTCSNIIGYSNDGDSGDVALRLRYISACSCGAAAIIVTQVAGLNLSVTLAILVTGTRVPVSKVSSVYSTLKQHR